MQCVSGQVQTHAGVCVGLVLILCPPGMIDPHSPESKQLKRRADVAFIGFGHSRCLGTASQLWVG